MFLIFEILDFQNFKKYFKTTQPDHLKVRIDLKRISKFLAEKF
jgi:hypothetical protein